MLRCLGQQYRSHLLQRSAQCLYEALPRSGACYVTHRQAEASSPCFVRCNSAAVAENDTAQPSRQHIESHLGPIGTSPTVPDAQPIVLVISGPSGVGKDAVVKALQELRPDLYFVVTATSRAMRPGEVEGSDYYFVSKKTFEQWLQEGNLLEHAVVYGEYKGIPRHQVEHALKNGSDVVLRIDVQGAATVRKLLPKSVHIFLAAESEAKLVDRLISRKTEEMDKLITRVQTARNECKHIDDFDYVVVNREGELTKTVAAISAIIEAEKARVKGRQMSALS